MEVQRNNSGQFVAGSYAGFGFKAGDKPWNAGIKNFRPGYTHTPETRAKIATALRGRHVSQSTKERLSIIQRGAHKSPSTEFPKGGVSPRKGVHLSDDTREKIRKGVLANPNRTFQDTSIEVKIERELAARGIQYEKQVSLAHISRVDFYLPTLRTVIQCDGCFYHGCPEHFPQWVRNKERDFIQDVILAFSGYRVFRFWEHEINVSPPQCVDKVFSMAERSRNNQTINTNTCQ